MKHTDSPVLGKYTPAPPVQSEELKACYARIAELEASLSEMVGIYWGDGDGIHPPPACIQRAMGLLDPHEVQP